MNKLIKIGSAVLFSGALLVSPYGEASAVASIKVHYIDVGQGDAIYIKMPSGEDVIIDGGTKERAMRSSPTSKSKKSTTSRY